MMASKLMVTGLQDCTQAEMQTLLEVLHRWFPNSSWANTLSLTEWNPVQRGLRTTTLFLDYGSWTRTDDRIQSGTILRYPKVVSYEDVMASQYNDN